jgi:hypothetical protein
LYKNDIENLIYKNIGYSGSVILFMVLLTPPIDTTLPEAPVAMVQSVAKEK